MPDKSDTPIRIVIADDHAIFRHGLRRLLDAEPAFQVVGEADDGDKAVELARSLKPDVLLLDLAMPRMHGIEALRELASAPSPVRTILLTAQIETPQIVEALQLGARGVVLKHAASELLMRSIHTVFEGQYWVGRDTVSNLIELLRGYSARQQPPRKTFNLTPRELEIVGAIVEGYTNKDMAGKFNVSEQTIKHHLTNIFDKLGVSNRLELALFAINHRLIGEQ